MLRNNQRKAWLYLLPALVLLILFAIVPLVQVIRLSILNDYSIVTNENTGIGFTNYTALFSEGGILEPLINSLIAALIAVPVSLLIALAIAIALNNIKVLNKVFTTIFFLPFVTSSIVIGYVIMIMFVKNDVSVGIFNWFIGLFGFEPIDWMVDSNVLKLVLYILYLIWRLLPFEIIIIICSLKSIKEEYYVSARIDNCSRVRQFNKITFPIIRPMLIFLLLIGFIVAIKDINHALGIFGNGMLSANITTLTGFIYSNLGLNTGVASAAAVLIFAIVSVIALVLSLTYRKVRR